MFFVTFGLLFGSEGTGWITLDMGGEELRGVAELTLTLVLFTDASRLNLRALRHDYPLPARLLGVGLPLTIGLDALAAKALFGGLTWLEVGLVGVILAPTDAALGQAVVRDRRLPVRVSQGLNVESGLNDGILRAAPADPARRQQRRRRGHPCRCGPPPRLGADRVRAAAGVVAATVGSVVMGWASRRGFISSSGDMWPLWRLLPPVTGWPYRSVGVASLRPSWRVGVPLAQPEGDAGPHRAGRRCG